MIWWGKNESMKQRKSEGVKDRKNERMKEWNKDGEMKWRPGTTKQPLQYVVYLIITSIVVIIKYYY